MTNKLVRIAAVALMALGLQVASAQAEWAGYRTVNIPANTDVRLTVPFTNHVTATHTVTSIAGTTVNFSAAPAITYTANRYYIRFTSGAANGLWATISSHTGTNSFFSVPAGSAAAVGLAVPGDTFRVYLHNTLGSVFPTTLNNVSFNSSTQILLFNNNAPYAQNRGPVSTAARAGSNWVGGGVNNNTALAPETTFILRNNSASTLKFITLGDAPDTAVAFLLNPANANPGTGDLYLGSGYPVDVLLRAGGLNGTSRQVLFYNSQATGLNKQASATAASAGATNWAGGGITATTVLPPAETFTYRLPAGIASNTKVTVFKPY
jgi:uncharacterized protein (TIGR02597 family)